MPITRTEWGVRLVDRRDDSSDIEVPSGSLDHAKGVVSWHNDPNNCSTHRAELLTREIIISDWRNVTA